MGGGGAGLPQDVRSPRRYWGVKFAAARPGVLSVLSVCMRVCVCAFVGARIPAAGARRLRGCVARTGSTARPGSAPVNPVRAVTRPP